MSNSTSPDPRLLAKAPKKLKNLTAYIIKYNGSVIEITPEISEISIYESIFIPFMYGEVTIIDGSAMLSTFPFIGQEKLRLIWDRENKTIEQEFYVTGVFDVVQINDSIGAYGLSFTSEKQMRNAFCLFSKCYKGNSAEIIAKIYKEYLQEDIVQLTTGALSHNVIFPYTKPFAAVDMVKRATPAEDGTPMFVFETLYGNKTYLNSMKQMLEQEPVIKLEPKNIVNTDSVSGITSDNMDNYRNQVYSMNLTKAYNTLDQIGAGSYGAQTIMIDIGTKSATITDFDFRQHAPPISKDWISQFFAFENVPNAEDIPGSNGVRVNGIRSTKLYVQNRNSLAYDDYPNLNSVDENVLAGMRSYMKRLTTTSISIHMNSITDIEVGKTVELLFPRFSPNLGSSDDISDRVNSGVYLISALRHYIKNAEYTMSIELVRDGMGKDASLDPNGSVPNFGAPLRKKVDLLPKLDSKLAGT
jgi:hypothetical protein